MKILVTSIIISLLATTALFAENTTTKSRLSADMRTMLNAVVDIQRAGFYSNKVGIKDATKKLIKSLDSLLETDAKEYLPKEQMNTGKFAKKRVKMIKMYAEDLVISIDSNDYTEALEDYTQILRQCTSCHSRIRTDSWK